MSKLSRRELLVSAASVAVSAVVHLPSGIPVDLGADEIMSVGTWGSVILAPKMITFDAEKTGRFLRGSAPTIAWIEDFVEMDE